MYKLPNSKQTVIKQVVVINLLAVGGDRLVRLFLSFRDARLPVSSNHFDFFHDSFLPSLLLLLYSAFDLARTSNSTSLPVNHFNPSNSTQMPAETRSADRVSNYNKFWEKKSANDNDTHRANRLDQYTEVVNGG